MMPMTQIQTLIGRPEMKILTVQEVLAALSVTRAQLYYAEEVGKIPPARRTSTGKRYYLPNDVELIRRKMHEASAAHGRAA